ncbi:MAG: RnfABCDGE type electron transport complex subunit D [Candidatus Aminicenantes bacterium]|nr:RnfABCDGE type electron transport complex subunit D [Candidatus Aminicenantes bacterium]
MTEARPFLVRSSPHLRAKDSTPRIMFRVVLSLVPACIASVYFFRFQALALILTCAAVSLATEELVLWARKKPLSTALDGSALITGILLALTLPPSFPPALAAVGALVSIGIGKQAFGGLGYNVFNPALVGRAFLSVAFPVGMTTWVPPVALKVDVSTFATPLANLKFQDAVGQGTLAPLRDLFSGNVGGCLGETSALALIIGGLYLLVRRTIDWRIPVGMTFSLAAFTGVFWLANPGRHADPLFHILAGGFLLGALFMATDMVTSPLSQRATWIYALGTGLIIGIIRLFSGYPEGVMYSILFMNAFVPLLNHYLRPRILGERRKG